MLVPVFGPTLRRNRQGRLRVGTGLTFKNRSRNPAGPAELTCRRLASQPLALPSDPAAPSPAAGSLRSGHANCSGTSRVAGDAPQAARCSILPYRTRRAASRPIISIRIADPPRRNEASRERSSLGPRSLNWAQDARHSNIPGKSR
jgi:hypothetical protein